jgi:hypothetical protein
MAAVMDTPTRPPAASAGPGWLGTILKADRAWTIRLLDIRTGAGGRIDAGDGTR